MLTDGLYGLSKLCKMTSEMVSKMEEREGIWHTRLYLKDMK